MTLPIPTPAANCIFTANSVNFLLKGILPGDLLYVDFVPVGSVAAYTGTSMPGLALKTIELTMAGTRTIFVFGNDDPADVTSVTKTGAVQQLNRVLGANVASFDPSGYLWLDSSYELTIHGGTAASIIWAGAIPSNGLSNRSPNYDGGQPYTIFFVLPHELYVVDTHPFADTLVENQQFHIVRPNTQHVGTTQMALNKTYSGLYYADIQLVSEGTDPAYNIDKMQKLTATNYTSLGYSLTTEYPHLAFSLLEKPSLHITPTIISVGASDDPENSLQIAGQNLQVNYEWSSLVAALQSFVSSDDERVVNENVLVRHLLPHYVRFDLTYRGGPIESSVISKINAYISNLQPDDILEAVWVQNMPLKMGATTVTTPINLVALVYGEDRSISAEQSMNYLNTGRLAGFFQESINVQKKTV